MPQANLQAKYDKIKKDRTIQNQIAQANARYILLNTQEGVENFPAYTIEDDRLNLLAFYYLNIGASLAEGEALEAASEPLEQGAAILEFVHGAHTNRVHTSEYFGLISSLAYYVSFQYSKSFILIKKLEAQSRIAKFISLFIQRDFMSLSQDVKDLKMDVGYSDEFLAKNSEEIDGSTRIFELQIGLALNNLLNHFWTGEGHYIDEAKSTLNTLKDIAELKADPGIWWVIRLLLLISDGIIKASFWNCLRAHYDMTNKLILDYIYSLAYQHPSGYYELFVTQRKAVVKVANPESKGSVISMPTSSGKTRIAELAILDSMIKNPNAKTLYIAPFRSLAFEIENSFEKILGGAGINISHLYGGGLFNKLDEEVIEESNVIIATPEKAKALLRSREDILADIKLVIIDEGHLLGSDNRHTVNEVFYEELRHFIHSTGGKFVVLSAVLPNAEDIAEWLNEDKATVVKSTWRPSDERIGILEWTGNAVNLDWKNKDERRRPTFNNNFVVSEELPWRKYQRAAKFFPGNNNEAIAATAHRLETFGTTLIFVGLRASVFVMARAYMKCLGENPPDHSWKSQIDWKMFELASIETYGDGNEWLTFAKKGILCHSADLQNDVRIPLERIMRSEKPKVIIATSTLAQGVNLGVASVIFASIYQAGNRLSPRDFWNIAGRAGRAFTDFEGKILVSSDESDKSIVGRKKTAYHRGEIHEYFRKESINHAQSGLLSALVDLKALTDRYDINFATLLELVSNNKLETLDEANDEEDESIATELDRKLDLIDDALLSIKYFSSEGEDDPKIVEDYFKKSLAYIQASKDGDIEEDELLNLVTARISGIIKKTGEDRGNWKSAISAGIPLNSGLYLDDKMQEILDASQICQLMGNEIEDKIELLKTLESIVFDVPCLDEERENVRSEDSDEIRVLWLEGKSVSKILQLENGGNIVNKLYSYTLPWILNAAAKKMRNAGNDEEAEIVEELSVLTEIGLPHFKAVKIYQAGIRSRMAAVELSEHIEDGSMTINDMKQILVTNQRDFSRVVSEPTREWLSLLVSTSSKRKKSVRNISFTYGKTHERTKTLIARKINGRQYLLSPNLEFQHDIEGQGEVDFSEVTDIEGVYFHYKEDDGNWHMVVTNPFIRVRG